MAGRLRRRGLQVCQITLTSDFHHDGPSVCQAGPHCGGLTSGVLCANLEPIQEKAWEMERAAKEVCPGLSLDLTVCPPSTRPPSSDSIVVASMVSSPACWCKSMMQTRRQSRRRMMNRARQQYDRGGLLPTAIHPICIRHPLRLPDAVSTRLRQHQIAGPNRFGQWIKGPHPGEKRWRAGLGWAGLAGAAGLHLPSHPLTSSVKSRLTRRRADASERMTWIWDGNTDQPG
jgi:hypothetical protein